MGYNVEENVPLGGEEAFVVTDEKPLFAPTVHAYAPEDVVANFMSLLNDIDFAHELQVLGVGFFHPFLRRRLKKELQATYVGLWSLALLHSFPQTIEEIFSHFLHVFTENMSAAEKRQWYVRCQEYRDMIASNGNKDFSRVSRHLLSFVSSDEQSRKADTLRLSLQLRNHYTFIFQRLI